MELFNIKSYTSRAKTGYQALIHCSFLLMIFAFAACKSDSKKEDRTLFPSTGQLTEVIVVSDKNTLDDSTRRLIKAAVGKSIPGLPGNGEASFRPIFIAHNNFKGYVKNHQNILVLLHADNLKILKQFYNSKDQGNMEQLIYNDEILGVTRKNLWSKNQKIFYLLASDKTALQSKLITRADEVLEIAKTQEQETATSKLYGKYGKKDTLARSTMKAYGFAIKKPNSYRVAKAPNSDFYWLSKETAKYDIRLFIYFEDYSSKEQLSKEAIIARRNRFLKANVAGPREGSYMTTESRVDPYFNVFNFKGLYAAELSGWYDVEGDNMGGPFKSYTVVDPNKKRIIVVEGNVFYPNEKKAKALREIELILQTLSIGSK